MVLNDEVGEVALVVAGNDYGGWGWAWQMRKRRLGVVGLNVIYLHYLEHFKFYLS